MIISHINKIADLLNMKVIIEGVETESQLNTLVEIGCEMFQGYYFSKPLCPEAFIALMKDQKKTAHVYSNLVLRLKT